MIEIYHNGKIEESCLELDGYSIDDGYLMVAADGGTATNTTVAAGGALSAVGGSVCNTAINPGGTMMVGASGVDKVRVLGGLLEIQTNGSVSNVDVLVNGTVQIASGGRLNAAMVSWGNVTMAGGCASNISMDAGVLTVKDGASATKTYLNYDGAIIHVETGGLICDTCADGTAVTVFTGGIAENTTLNDYTLYFPSTKETRYYHATLTLKSKAVHRGYLSIASESLVIAEEGSVIDFSLAERKPGPSALINDFSRISGTPDFTMTVCEEQTAGIYALAGNATAFDAAITLQCGEFSVMDITEGGTVTYHNSVYTLALEDGTLSADVVDFAQSGSADRLSWGDINGAESYTLELGQLQLEIATPGMDLLGLGNGDYTWRVRNSIETDNWQTGEAFSQTAAAEKPQRLEAETNGTTDLFFAKADGVWGSDYCAENVFTGERRSLKGMARITDVFAGSEDASMLVLCGDGNVAGNGIALFLDDIYSAMPSREDSETRAVVKEDAWERISRIQEIYAGSGDDLVDLTSARFHCDNFIAVHGGAGNDILWGSGNGCRLFGDEGDDSLTGTAGNDILVGGSGNDTIQCLGGEDILYFGTEWGNDLVIQHNDGKVTLWFDEGNEQFWNAEKLVYSNGFNSIRIAGGADAMDVTLKFGNDGSALYAQLCGQGAFLA